MKFYLLALGLLFLIYMTQVTIQVKSSYILCGQQVKLIELDSYHEHRKGLMGVKFLNENEGALFIYDKPKKVSFWMKNTKIPLSIGFFNKHGWLLESREMKTELGKPDNELTSYISNSNQIKYAVEMNKGFFKDKKDCFLKKSKINHL